MRGANLSFGVVSLLLGGAMVALSLSQRGSAVTLGLVLGGLLLINGALRLWMARPRP